MIIIAPYWPPHSFGKIPGKVIGMNRLELVGI